MDHLSLSDLVIVIASILVSLSVHEFMHAFVGFKLGDTTAEREGRLSLNPLNHIDPVMTVILPIVTIVLFGAPILAAKPVPFDPRFVKFDEFGAALIAAAGPFSNLLLAVAGAFVENWATPGGFLAHALGIFVVLNVALFVFNLLPIPPLDGSRVLYAFAPEPLQDFMRSIEPLGLFIVFGLVLAGGLGGFLSDLNQAVLNWLP
ncbi:MAG: zinc metalloprotease ywhC [Candidatus Saccharibacteria bacterium]|nr:zinc metalloprotease ywhC [Candidatus Saccharibacteria bacterium]